MTPSDWIDARPSDWMEQAMPGWRNRSYSEMLRTPPSEWWSMMYAPFLDQMTGLATGLVAQPQPQPGPHRHGHHRHHHDCDCGCHDHDRHEGHAHGCSDCGPEPCECFCRIGDVDLAVYSRVGEQRVVSIVVENERRREKEIKLELSDWTTRGGNEAAVQTVFLEPNELTLAPRSEQEVTLVFRVRPRPQPGKGQSEGKGGSDVSYDAAVTAVTERAQLTDVDSCQVVTADLRLVGCERRSIRIGVAILPRDCDPIRVGCGCGCC
jgi:hypothetical protein